uniref:MrcB family domain-containing protein n=1 Tax=Gelidibacter sp. TaxID=2018083 RepID=UPI004049749B
MLQKETTMNNEEIFELIKQFIVQSKTSNLKTSSYPKTFKGLNLKVSFGQGVPARIPWIGLSKSPNTISKGIYPVFLFYKEFNKLVLAFGLSETEKSEFSWNNTESYKTVKEWHIDNFNKTPDRYGSSFIKSVYDLNVDLNRDIIEKDLNEIISEYSKLNFGSNQDCNYWIFQGSPKIYNMVDGLRTNSIKTWTVSSHKNKIKEGDKFILWLTGESAGCYALGRVASSVMPMKEEDSEMDHYILPTQKIENNRVNVDIEHNFFNKPIFWEKIKDNILFKDFKGGNQGTNFSATKEEYDELIKLIKNIYDRQYWVYAPGAKGSKWDDFYEEGVMGLGWDELGDLKKYKTRTELKESLIIHYGGIGSKKNDISANDDFVNKIKIGDIIIAKKGITQYLGYGVVLSEYYYDENSKDYRSRRKVNWLKKGEWLADHKIAIKTLTDVTIYTSYVEKLKKLLGIEMEELKGIKLKNIKPLNQILYGPPGTGKTYKLQKEYFDQFTIKETSLTRDQYLESIIANLSWWQVISIAVLDLGGTKVSKIQDHEFIRIKAKFSSSKTIVPTIWGQLQSHTVLECPNVNVSLRMDPLFFFKNEESKWTIDKDLLDQYYPEAFEILEKCKHFVPDSNKTIKNLYFVKRF